MTTRKAFLGALALCAVCMGVFAATSSATSQYVCEEKAGQGSFNNSNCDVSEAGGKFHTVKTTEPIETVTTPTSVLKLSTTFMGINIAVQCNGLSGAGIGTNEVVEGANEAIGREINWKLSECAVTKPEKLGCKVNGGAIATNALKSTTYMISETVTGVKYTPATGTTIASMVLEGCTLSGTYKLEGGIVGVVNNSKRAELQSTVASSKEGGLTIGGNSVVIEGSWHTNQLGHMVAYEEP